MTNRFEFHGAMTIIAFAAACLSASIASPAPDVGSDCGSLESSKVFEHGDTLSSCNGDFILSHQDGNIVLVHTPSTRQIWQSPVKDGAYFAFYDPENQPIAMTLPDYGKPPQQAQSTPGGLTNPSDGTQTALGQSADGLQQSGGTQPLSAEAPPLISSNLTPDDSLLPVQSGPTAADSTSSGGATLPSLTENPSSLVGLGSTNFGDTSPLSSTISPSSSGGGSDGVQLESSNAGEKKSRSSDDPAGDSTSSDQRPVADVKARAVLQDLNPNYLLSLKLEDNGNLAVNKRIASGAESTDWESKTSGTSCDAPGQSCTFLDQTSGKRTPCGKSLFIMDFEKSGLGGHVAEQGFQDQGDAIIADPCALLHPTFVEKGAYTKKPNDWWSDASHSIAARDTPSDSEQPDTPSMYNNILDELHKIDHVDNPDLGLQYHDQPLPVNPNPKTPVPVNPNPKTPAPASTPGTSSPSPPAGNSFKPALRCKTNVLVHQLSVTFYVGPFPHIRKTLIAGTARLEKLFCYDGYQVFSANKKNPTPDPAGVFGQPVDWAGWAGFIYAGQAPGSNMDEYVPQVDSDFNVVYGEAGLMWDHVSKREVRFEWKLPYVNAYVSVDVFFGDLMYMKVSGNGKADCRGGKECTPVSQA